MTTYSTPMGDLTRLTNFGSAVIEGGSSPNWTYSSGGGNPGGTTTSFFPYALLPNVDGSVAVRSTTINYLRIGFNKTNSRPGDYGTYDYTLASGREGGNYFVEDYTRATLTATTLTPAADGDIHQIRRTGSTIYAEVSHDNGVTWKTIYTWAVDPAATLYPVLMTPYSSVVNAVYSKNIRPASAVDTFTGLAANTAINNMAWDTADISWPSDSANRLIADGNGYAVRSIPASDAFTAAWWNLRSTDTGMAVFFRHTMGDDTLAPQLNLFAPGGTLAAGSGVSLRLGGGQLTATEVKTADNTVGNTTSVAAALQANGDYCLEICLGDDPSNLVYNFRLLTAPGGVRAGLVAQGSLTAQALNTQRCASILGVAQTSAMDPISRVESLSYPFALGSAFPSDDGTTVTALVGTGSDCQFLTIAAWWASLPASLVAAGRNYVGLMDKTSEFVLADNFTFSGKITDASHTITLKPRPGHAYYEHPNFLTNALGYNPNNGVAVACSKGGLDNGVLFVNQDWMTLRGLQVQNRSSAGPSGSVLVCFKANSSVQLCYIDAANMAGNYTYIAKFTGVNSKHFGNFFVARNSISNGVAMGDNGIQIENCTIVAASDAALPGNAGGINSYDYSKITNCAVFGFPVPYSGGGGAVTITNLATDAATVIPPSGTIAGTLTGLVFANQFVGTTKAGIDLRTKSGSALYNAGVTPSVWDTAAVTGSRAQQGATDIGAYEAPRFIPTKVVITGKSSGTTGYTNSLRIALDQSLLSGESETISLSDDGGGSFSPSSVTLTDTTTFQFVTHTPPTALGACVVTAHESSGSFTLSDGTFNYQVVPPTPASKLVVLNNASGADMATSAQTMNLGETLSFNLGTDNPMFGTDSVSYMLAASLSGTFVPASGTLDKTNLNDDVVFTPNTSGTYTLTLTPSGSPVLPVVQLTVTVKPRPPTYGPGQNVYEVGVGRQFTTMTALQTYLVTRDLVADQASVLVKIFDSMTVKGSLFAKTSNADYYITVQPGEGQSYHELATSAMYHYPNAGVELTIAGGDFLLMHGSRIADFRLRFDDGSRLSFDAGGAFATSGVPHQMKRCRLLINRPGVGYVVYSGNYSQAVNITDSVFVVTQPGNYMYLGDGGGDFVGNTHIALGSAIGGAYMSWGTFANYNAKIQNNVFIDHGGAPMQFSKDEPATGWTTKTFNSNYTNNAIVPAVGDTIMTIGFIADTVNPFVANKASDLRPAANSPLLGKASPLAVSSLDGANANRGYSPDAGAFQLTPATSLPIITKASQTVQGQTVTLNATYLNVINSVTVTLPADPTNPNGAVTQGPVPVTFAGGTMSIAFNGVPAGQYGAPIFTGVNDGGSSVSTGFVPVTIAPIFVKAALDDFVSVANAVLASGKPVLPFMGGGGANLTPPTVSLIPNSTDITVAGSLTLNAVVGSVATTQKVEFYKNGNLVSTANAAPYSYNEAIGNGVTSNDVYSAKVYGINGLTTSSKDVTVHSRTPSANPTTPTVVSITAVDGNADVNYPHLEVMFSEAMDTSKDFDFAGAAAYAMGCHGVVGSFWATGSNTKLILTTDRYYPVFKGEPLTLSYTKSVARGWRSAAGVMVESFFDVPVTNSLSEPTGSYMYDTFVDVAAGASIAGRNLKGYAINSAQTGDITTVMTWPAATHLKGDGNGGVIPADASHLISGVLTLGQLWFAKGGYVPVLGSAVFFKMNAITDSPYGFVYKAGDTNDMAMGAGIQAWPSNNGSLHVTHRPRDAKNPIVVPDLAGIALKANQEYCFEMFTRDGQMIQAFGIRLWESTNGVRTNLVASEMFHFNESITGTTDGSGSPPLVKLYQVNQGATPAAITRVEIMGYDVGAPEVLPVMTLATDARLTQLSNVTESGTGPYTYTGNGAALSQTPGGVFSKLFMNNSGNDNGAMFTVGNVVDNLHFGVTFSLSSGTPAELLAPNYMLLGLKASSIGNYYEVIVDGKIRTAHKQVIIGQGDTVRVRTIGTELLVEVMKSGGNWTRLGYLRNVVQNLSNSMLSVQLILPGASTVSSLKQ